MVPAPPPNMHCWEWLSESGASPGLRLLAHGAETLEAFHRGTKWPFDVTRTLSCSDPTRLEPVNFHPDSPYLVATLCHLEHFGTDS